ncbi:MAG: polysaccharide export protein [Chitinophagaceae bacterium]|nr:MAG: polysaccharide export protein [Chitinophagaceae bacterium]
MRLFSGFAFALVFFLASCKSQSGIINYLQHTDTAGKFSLNQTEPRIQKNDLLSIKVYSQSADPRIDAPYNLPEQNAGGTSTASPTAGFLVDAAGTIEYPMIGSIKVAGLTKTELAQQIKERLQTELKNPTVIVRFLNYRVTVLGEVRSPGTFTIPTERVTILEALGLAGDITDFGKRDTVKVAREVNGQMEIGSVNLRSGEVFNSPYYRLQQNDVIFVEQSRKKLEQEERQSVAQRVGIAASIVTAAALIINVLRR